LRKLVLLVHSDTEFRNNLASALDRAGHDVVAFAETMPAIDALEAERPPDMLITRTQFPEGMPTGLSLARMAMMKRRGIKVLITGRAHLADLAEGVGEFHPHPVDMLRLLGAAERLLAES
jgi:DNA-binding NtrC family response regulator